MGAGSSVINPTSTPEMISESIASIAPAYKEYGKIITDNAVDGATLQGKRLSIIR